MKLIAFALMAPLVALMGAIAHADDYRVGERLQPAPGKTQAGYTVTKWETLVPSDWHPEKLFEGINLSMLNDGDPKATQALDRLRKEWENAPANAALNGARIRIAGFLVPLERRRTDITEFLLVPYFGACIHTPPPPSNQIIHVFAVKPVKDGPDTAAVWVSGVLETTRSETGLGAAGYQMRGEIITPYRERR